MSSLKHAIAVLGTLLVVAGVALVHAQEQNIVQGQLVRVDSTAKVIVIRTETASQMQFSYTDDTKVNGADDTVAGLGTLAGTQVTVQYTKTESKLIATQVDIHAPEGEEKK